MTMLEFLRRCKGGKAIWTKASADFNDALRHYLEAKTKGWILAGEPHRSSRGPDGKVDAIPVIGLTALGERELERLGSE